MSQQVALRCRCGNVRGIATELSPTSGSRLVCYCDDCQAFARFLGRPDVLDAHGGTDICQMAPSRVRITEGAALLRSMRLAPKGLLRWYTDCCRTPVANTLSARVPFAGIIHAFMDHEADGRSRDEALGKPTGFIHGRFARGGDHPHIHRTAPFGVILRSVRLILGWWIAGRGTPSPFFDEKTKEPRALPHVLSAAEREALNTVA